MPLVERSVDFVGRFERHGTPDGDECYFDVDPHRYYLEVHESKKAAGGYSYVQGSQLIGCSTPAKALDTNTDPLLWWAAKLDQIGVAELASLSLDSGGDLDWLRDQKSIATALREANLTWDKVRDQAAVRGTNVHELIFLALATGSRVPSLAKLSDEERAYGQAALKWWHTRNPDPIYAEQVTLHREHRVAGRFDLLCKINGETVLIDAKTREKGAVRRGDHVQLAGYEMCNRSCGIGESDRQLALILTPWGEFREYDGLSDEGDFLSALDAYRRGGELEKRMRAAEKAVAVAA